MKKLFFAVLLMLLAMNGAYGYQQPEGAEIQATPLPAPVAEATALDCLPKSEVVILVDLNQVTSSPVYPTMLEIERKFNEKLMSVNPTVAASVGTLLIEGLRNQLVVSTNELALGVGRPSDDLYLILKGNYDADQLISTFKSFDEKLKIESENYFETKIYSLKYRTDKKKTDKPGLNADPMKEMLPMIGWAIPDNHTLIFSTNAGVKSVLDVRAHRRAGVTASKSVIELLDKLSQGPAFRMVVLPPHRDDNQKNEPQEGGEAQSESPQPESNPFMGFYGSIDMLAGLKGNFNIQFRNAEAAQKTADDMRNSIVGAKAMIGLQAQQQPQFNKLLEALELVKINSANEEVHIEADVNTQLTNDLLMLLESTINEMK